MNDTENKQKNKSEIKEGFCPACLAVPLAIAGAGTAGAGAVNKDDHNKTKNILLWVGIGLVVISILIALYFLTRCRTCGKK